MVQGDKCVCAYDCVCFLYDIRLALSVHVFAWLNMVTVLCVLH